MKTLPEIEVLKFVAKPLVWVADRYDLDPEFAIPTMILFAVFGLAAAFLPN